MTFTNPHTNEKGKDTFVVPGRKGSPEGSASAPLAVGQVLHVQLGGWEGLAVHLEGPAPLLVLYWPSHHQGQLKQEDVQPLFGNTHMHAHTDSVC